jgi:alpha-tubulin suppressor-like RCC1 family protein
MNQGRLCVASAYLVLLTACGGSGSDSPGPVTRLEVSPSAILLSSAAPTQTVKVRAFDTNGAEVTNAPISFTSSQPAQISVSTDGTVTAVAPIGSAFVTATSGSISSQPLVAASVETLPGSVLVSDAQVITGPQPVAGTVVGVGGRYTVVLAGIAAPAPGTIVLASGSYPIAGKVVDSSVGSGNAVTVTLELVPLNQLFRNASVSGTLSAQQVAQLVKPAAGEKSASVTRRSRPNAVASGLKKFGTFECTTSFDTSLLNVDLAPTITQSLAFAYDLSVLDGVSKAFLLAFSGTINASLTGTVTVGAANGSLDCTAPLFTIPIPITGLFSAIIAPEAPLGLTFRMDLDASTNVSYGVSGTVGASLTFGVKHDADGNPVKINDGTVSGQIDVAPAFANTATRVEFTEFAGLTAGLTVGNVIGKLPNAIDVSAGSEFSSSWGKPSDAALDPLFTTEYQLKGKLSIGPGPGLQQLLDWASEAISIDISAAAETTIGRSPMLATVRLSQNLFKVGDSLSFKLALDPTSVRFPLGLGAYNVQEVRIYRLDQTNQAASQVATAIATDGQTDFTIPWVADGDGTVELAGKPAFYAFVVPRVLNILRTDFPIELGRVNGPSIESRPVQAVLFLGGKAAFDAYLDGAKSATGVTWSSTGGGINALGEYTAGSVPGVYEVRATRASTGEVAISSVQVQAVVSPPSVTSVTVSPASPIVGNQATFSVNGTSLQSGYTLSLPGCTATEVSSVSTTLRQFVCTLTVSGSNLAGTVTAQSGTTSYSFVVNVAPAPAPSASAAARIGLGVNHTCGVTAVGTIKCWGMNEFGELGDGTSTDRLTPVDVSAFSGGAIAVSAGGWHTCALTTTGGIKCWGKNQSGQLGDGTLIDRRIPVDVSGLSSGVIAIAAGVDHTCALTSAAGIKCWGSNYWGQLGDGTSTNRSTPVDVSSLIGGVMAMASGYAHTCALTTAGGVKCWGMNQSGQLGDGTITNRLTPVNVSGLSSGAIALVTGYGHSCVLTTAGGVKCWGANYAGQLGDPALGYRLVPGDVSSLNGSAIGLALGVGDHNCILTTADGIKCWGSNGDGEVGSGIASLDQPTPVDVVTLGSGVVAVAVGTGYTCALTILGGIKCWGGNLRGELGDGTTTSRLTPVDVVGF